MCGQWKFVVFVMLIGRCCPSHPSVAIRFTPPTQRPTRRVLGQTEASNHRMKLASFCDCYIGRCVGGWGGGLDIPVSALCSPMSASIRMLHHQGLGLSKLHRLQLRVPLCSIGTHMQVHEHLGKLQTSVSAGTCTGRARAMPGSRHGLSAQPKKQRRTRTSDVSTTRKGYLEQEWITEQQIDLWPLPSRGLVFHLCTYINVPASGSQA